MLPRSYIDDNTVNQCSETTLILIVLRYFAKSPVRMNASASHMDIWTLLVGPVKIQLHAQVGQSIMSFLKNIILQFYLKTHTWQVLGNILTISFLHFPVIQRLLHLALF